MRNYTKYLVIIALLCFCGAGAFYYSAHAKDKKEDYTEKARPVKTLTVSKSDHNATRSFPGKVRSSKRVDLSFEVSGNLIELPIRDGMVVKAGQVLARLDRRTFENNLLAAEAAFTEATQNYKRTQKLIQEKVVAVSVLDKSKSVFDTAHAQLEIAKKALSDTEIKAPFDGIITTRYVENHQKVSPTQLILNLQDMENIEIVIQIPESIMVYSTPDEYKGNLKVKFDAIPDREFDAKVYEYSIDADNQTQTYEVVLTMPTSDEFNFLPGMTATVTSGAFIVSGEARQDTIWLPSTAIQGEERGNKSYIYIIGRDNKVEKKYITIGSPTDSGIPVFSGLNEGEQVIIAGSSYLRDGMLVRPL